MTSHAAFASLLMVHEILMEILMKKALYMQEGKTLEIWATDTLSEFVSLYEQQVEDHHDNEEKIAFPALKKVSHTSPP